MTLLEYYKKLTLLINEHADKKLIYSSDDEGNNFDYVVFKPSIVNFIPNEGISGEKTDNSEEVICIN